MKKPGTVGRGENNLRNAEEEGGTQIGSEREKEERIQKEKKKKKRNRRGSKSIPKSHGKGWQEVCETIGQAASIEQRQRKSRRCGEMGISTKVYPT